jgi:hypothetical protein
VDHPRRRPALALAAVLALGMVASVGKPSAEATVGMVGKLDQVVIPGPELEAKPVENRDAPMIVRVVDTYPHGEGSFRYDLEFTGLEPGLHDLRPYLRRKDSQPMAAGAQGPFVAIKSVLPAGQVPPREPSQAAVRGLGGYRTLMIGLGVAWGLGLAGLVWAGRNRRRADAALAQRRPPTLAERLRPLVEQASAGTIDPARLAELERLLLGHWSRRLGLRDVPPAVLIARLREHEEAGPLIARLEHWLHAPPGMRTEEVDVAALLAPYRDLPADPSDEPEGQGAPIAEKAGVAR